MITTKHVQSGIASAVCCGVLSSIEKLLLFFARFFFFISNEFDLILLVLGLNSGFSRDHIA